jgi:hypothetical protein
MVKGRKLLILLITYLLLILPYVVSYSIMISEVVFNYPYEKEKNQYIEIINDSPYTIDLRNYDIYLQGYKINLTILSNDIESDDIKYTYYLNPGDVAVILPYDYLTSSIPFYFSNTIIFFSSTKYLGKNGPIKKEDISTIKIVSNGVVIDSLPSINNNSVNIERIFHGSETNTLQTDIISPGYIRNENLYIHFGKLLYNFPDTIEIFLNIQTNVNQISLTILGRGEILLSRESGNLFRGTVVPRYNGEKIIAKFQNIYSSTRALDIFNIGNLEESLAINEVCFYPSKSWFSYFSSGTLLNSTNTLDKYIEIVNFSKSNISITNSYIHVMSPLTNYYIRLLENAYYSSIYGYSTNLLQISPGEYLIAKVGDVKHDSLVMLKDNHPYRGGKILSLVEMKGLNIFPLAHSNYYIYESNRTVSLLPDGLPTKLGGKYRNYYETPAKYNGFSTPSIIVDNEYKKVGEILKLLIITKEKEPFTEVVFRTKNSRILRTFLITNQGFWYYGEFTINKLGEIPTEEDDEINIEFTYNGQKYERKVFVIPQSSYPIGIQDNPFLEKEILNKGEKIRIFNISKGDEITIFTFDYYPVLKVVSDKKGIFEVSTSNLVRGIYIVMIKSKKGNYVTKILLK